MTRDFEFDWKPLDRFRAEVMTAKGAANRGTADFAIALVVASLIVGFLLTCWSGISSRALTLGAAFAFLAAMVYAGVGYSSVHIVEVDSSGGYSTK